MSNKIFTTLPHTYILEKLPKTYQLVLNFIKKQDFVLYTEWEVVSISIISSALSVICIGRVLFLFFKVYCSMEQERHTQCWAKFLIRKCNFGKPLHTVLPKKAKTIICVQETLFASEEFFNFGFNPLMQYLNLALLVLTNILTHLFPFLGHCDDMYYLFVVFRATCSLIFATFWLI